jgi:hypothetical protein
MHPQFAFQLTYPRFALAKAAQQQKTVGVGQGLHQSAGRIGRLAYGVQIWCVVVERAHGSRQGVDRA